jgi:hypothetical protein
MKTGKSKAVVKQTPRHCLPLDLLAIAVFRWMKYGNNLTFLAYRNIGSRSGTLECHQSGTPAIMHPLYAPVTLCAVNDSAHE